MNGWAKLIHIKAIHWFMAFTFAALCLSLAFAGSISPVSAAESTLPVQDGERVIIIDPGHGGFDGGAVGANGTVEKDVNLAISLKLRDMLSDAGFTVVMTREDDSALNGSEDTTIRRKKISDMHNRLNLTKLYPGSVLISIHQNKLAGDSSVRGAQVFYSPNKPESKELAESIQNQFNAYLQPQKARTVVKTGKNLYLFYHAENTAVLCECGFLSNPQEESLLCTDAYQYRIANCIYRGLLIMYEERTGEKTE
jgi:N-acetylmuramoyl-L-alanine amidase